MSTVFRYLMGWAGLLAFYIAGQAFVVVSHLPLPAPLAGMLLFFAYLVWRGRHPDVLLFATRPLLRHMSVLFVPAVLGVGLYWAQISDNILSLTLALFFTTLISLGIAAWSAQRILASRSKPEALTDE